MNLQKENGVEWTRFKLPGGIVLPGYTANPIAGCVHDCEFEMPNGETAICYAKRFADSLRSDKFFPSGFATNYWHPKRLEEISRVKKSGGVFIGSMSDVFGQGVQDWQINQLLDKLAACPQHIFFMLTKNAPRLTTFATRFPPNVLVGVSLPPSAMFGQRLKAHQQEAMLRKSLSVLTHLNDHRDVPIRRWMSFEPLTWDSMHILSEYPNALDWAVIGAATTDGGRAILPDVDLVMWTTGILREWDIPIFYKGNLRGMEKQLGQWLEDFPRLPYPFQAVL